MSIQCGELLSASWLFLLHVIYIRLRLVPHQLALPVSANVLCTYGIMNLKIKDSKLVGLNLKLCINFLNSRKLSVIRSKHYLVISFKNMSYAGKCSWKPVVAVNDSKVNLPFVTSAANGTIDPNHTNASSPTLGSFVT